MNPFGSIKDRTAWFMLKDLELRDDQALVEPSAGNTGIALAALANAQGTPIEIAVPEGVPESKKAQLRFLGAEVIEVEDELCPIYPSEGARGVVRSMVESEAFDGKYVSPNQYESALNVAAHYHTTGPEIWRQTEGRVRAFVAGFGTCGTITGVGRFLKEQDPTIKVVAVEPQTGHRLPGLKSFGEAKQPGILDWSVIDDVVRVDDDPAYTMTKRLWREEGLMVGPSTGAVVVAAQQYGLDSADIAVGVSPDSGFKYGSFFSEILGRQE